MTSYEFWSVLGTWLAAGATLLASLVALSIGLKEFIWKWFFPVSITLEWENCEPYAQCSTWSEGMSRPEAVMFRLKLINHGKTGAKDVQVLIENLERLTPDDEIMKRSFQPLRGFVPVSLKWTHLNHPKLDYFPCGSSRFLDFGLWRWQQTEAHPALHLFTEVPLYMSASVLRSAKYRCQISVTGCDGVFYKALWSFEFADDSPHYKDKTIAFIAFKMKPENIISLGKRQAPCGCSKC